MSSYKKATKAVEIFVHLVYTFAVAIASTLLINNSIASFFVFVSAAIIGCCIIDITFKNTDHE